MSKTIKRTIIWHPAATAPKTGEHFTSIAIYQNLYEGNFWISEDRGFRLNDFTHWTRDKVTP